jgi:hypothetical protein
MLQKEMAYEAERKTYWFTSEPAFCSLSEIRGEVNNYPQCSCICVSVGSTVILRSITMRGFLVIISAQV